MSDRKHWPDCYVNHGPPGASCDMGPDCGEVTAETLTDAMVRSFYRSLTSELEALDDSDANGIAAVYDLRGTVHVALSQGGYEPDPYETRKHLLTVPAARARIAAAINARRGAGS